jgi:hypothetical protein
VALGPCRRCDHALWSRSVGRPEPRSRRSQLMISCKNRLTRRLCQQGFNHDRVRAEGIRARGRAPPVPADLAAHPAFLLTMARAWFGRQPRAMGRRSGVGPSACSCPWATGRLVRAISLVAPVRRVRSCSSVSPARDETGPMTLKSRRSSGPGVPRSRPRSVEAAIWDQRRARPAPRVRPRRHGCDGAAGAWCRSAASDRIPAVGSSNGSRTPISAFSRSIRRGRSSGPDDRP